MSTLLERVAKLEERLDGLEDKLDERFENLEQKLDRNNADATNWRNNTRTALDTIMKKLSSFDSLVDQAKGARWLAGLILTVVGAAAIAGLKSAFEWLSGHWH